MHPSCPPTRPRVQGNCRDAGKGALRSHRLRRGFAATELRRAGRICRLAGDPCLPSVARRPESRCFDPDLCPRHQPGLGSDVRHGGGGGCVRRQRQRRCGRHEKAEQYKSRLAALMITYPSTHGVFEDSITEICDIIHAAGGVYMDGANMNALVGTGQTGQVRLQMSSHLNLHKTFCIPHGGGGPGVGPVAVRSHLAPFLPGHPLGARQQRWGRLCRAARLGQHLADFIDVHTDDGRPRPHARNADGDSECQLHRAPPGTALPGALHRQEQPCFAHECILDIRCHRGHLRNQQRGYRKRLIDYGFHAPTMSFPVAGTLMVEPTESESKYELDRFCGRHDCHPRRDPRGRRRQD